MGNDKQLEPGLFETPEATAQNFNAHIKKCLRLRKLSDCRRAVEWIAVNPDSHYVETLALIAEHETSPLLNLVTSSDEWLSLSILAIEILGRIDTAEVTTIVAQRLMDNREKVREASQRVLAKRGTRAATAIVSMLETPYPNFKRLVAAVQTLGLIGSPVATNQLAGLISGRIEPDGTHFGFYSVALQFLTILFILIPFLTGGFGAVLLPVGIALLINSRVSRRRRRELLELETARSLMRIGDVRCIPELVATITHEAAAISGRPVTRTLISLLKRLEPEHARLLDSRTERRLTDLFRTGNSRLIKATVRALEYVGTGQSVEPVKRLCRTRPLFAYGADITAEAKRVLPVLLERKQFEEAPQHLLRPSSAYSQPSELLLRPASEKENDATAALELLRPGASE